jgi:hypothetical protein
VVYCGTHRLFPFFISFSLFCWVLAWLDSSSSLFLISGWFLFELCELDWALFCAPLFLLPYTPFLSILPVAADCKSSPYFFLCEAIMPMRPLLRIVLFTGNYNVLCLDLLWLCLANNCLFENACMLLIRLGGTCFIMCNGLITVLIGYGWYTSLSTLVPMGTSKARRLAGGLVLICLLGLLAACCWYLLWLVLIGFTVVGGCTVMVSVGTGPIKKVGWNPCCLG